MVDITKKREGTKSLDFSLLGAGVVVGLYVLTRLFQKAGYENIILKIGSLIGGGTIIGLLLCLVGIVLGILAIRTTNRTERQNSYLSILIGLIVLVGFAYYTYLGMQSPSFRPVH